MELPGNKNVELVALGRLKEEDTRTVLRNIMRNINEMYRIISLVVNANEIVYIAQDAQPTPDEGKWMIWEDTDATGGNPQAYIVTTQGGSTWTFASVETA